MRERLTEKYNDGYITKNYFAYSKTSNELKEDNYNALCKLGKLEDYEEELGIDLITLFKALKNGAWTEFNNEISKCDECEYVMFDMFIYFYWKNSGKHLVFLLKDYGKYWALTKEELEEGK